MCGFAPEPLHARGCDKQWFFLANAIGSSSAFPPLPKGQRSERMHGKNRNDIKPGLRVHMTQKQDQRTGKLTSGVVKDILTKSPFHSRGIKVRLQTGDVGRVQEMVEARYTEARDD